MTVVGVRRLPAFAGMTVVRPGMAFAGTGWRSARSPSPRRERRWLAFGAVTLPAFAGTTVVGVRRGHPRPAGDGWRSARSPSPHRGWIPAFAGMTVVGVRRGHPHPTGDGFPPSRERRWLAFGAVTLTPPGMDSRLRGNDGGWRSARSPSPHRGWIPAFAGMTVVGVRRGHPHPTGDGFPRLTNEVQHLVRVLPWEIDIVTSPLKSGVRLPDYRPRAVRSGRSLQVWIARHRRSLGS